MQQRLRRLTAASQEPAIGSRDPPRRGARSMSPDLPMTSTETPHPPGSSAEVLEHALFAAKRFLVIATQNPIESEGVYPLPEAQRDRFLMKVPVGYPTDREEAEIARRMSVEPPVARAVLDADRLVGLQNAAAHVFVHDAVLDYV